MGWLRTWREAAAVRELAVLGARLRGEGLEGVGPHLRAAIDQHAAAVRDILALTAGRAGPVQLAAYSRGCRMSRRIGGGVRAGTPEHRIGSRCAFSRSATLPRPIGRYPVYRRSEVSLVIAAGDTRDSVRSCEGCPAAEVAGSATGLRRC